MIDVFKELVRVSLVKHSKWENFEARADPNFCMGWVCTTRQKRCAGRGSPPMFFLINFKALITQRIIDIRLHMRYQQEACNVRFSDIFDCFNGYHWFKFYMPSCKCTNILAFFVDFLRASWYNFV